MNEIIKFSGAEAGQARQSDFRAFFDAAHHELDEVSRRISLLLAEFTDAEVETLCDRAAERYNTGCPMAHFIAEATADEYGRRFNSPGAA